MLTRKQIQFTTRQTKAIRREALRRGVSESAVVRELVERSLLQAGPAPTVDQRERMLRAIGRFRSGHRNTAEKHDRVLAEAFADEE
jgi:hypothetical protein